MLTTVLIIILILILLGAVPSWPYSRGWGYGPSGVVGLILVIPLAAFLGLDQHILNTIQGREISANYHLDQAVSNLQTVYEHPLGVGLGWVGARAKRFDNLPLGRERYTTESYLLQTAMELGLPGIVVFLLIVVATGITVYTNIFRLTDTWSRAMAVSAVSFRVLHHAIDAVYRLTMRRITVSLSHC